MPNFTGVGVQVPPPTPKDLNEPAEVKTSQSVLFYSRACLQRGNLRQMRTHQDTCSEAALTANSQAAVSKIILD